MPRLIPMQEADVTGRNFPPLFVSVEELYGLEDSVAVLVETENVALAKTFVKLIRKHLTFRCSWRYADTEPGKK